MVKKKKKLVSGGLDKKSSSKSEDKQLAWVVAIIVVVFVVTLGTYYLLNATKGFEFGGVEWIYEDYDTFSYYHGRFGNLLGADYIYNIYLANDPRTNNVTTEGIFNKFKYGVVISTSPEFDLCRGDASRAMSDLGRFLMEGLGAGQSEAGSIDEEIANASKRRFATCDNINDRTIIVVQRGNDSVVQDGENPNCYVISVGDCNDASAVEKFMLKVIEDFSEVQ